MENVFLLLQLLATLAVLMLAMALFTNVIREHKSYRFQLKPNCLLTRHPVVFLTGTRSVFYFRRYWNSFPVLLAEHGYEVFTLHLPWKGPARAKKLKEFLDQAEVNSSAFHFIMDQTTKTEFSELLSDHHAVLSQTVPNAERAPSAARVPRAESSLFLRLALRLHYYFSAPSPQQRSPSAEELGAEFPKGSGLLLHRMQELGEQDFLA